MKIKFLERINLVSPIKIKIGVEMNPSDKITFRPRNTEIPTEPHLHEIEVPSTSEPNTHKELPSKEDQDIFEELLGQQRGALRRTIDDLGSSIAAYKAKIAEHEKMILKAKEKLGHINGLIA